jgi:hypothetical protein
MVLSEPLKHMQVMRDIPGVAEHLRIQLLEHEGRFIEPIHQYPGAVDQAGTQRFSPVLTGLQAVCFQYGFKHVSLVKVVRACAG